MDFCQYSSGLLALWPSFASALGGHGGVIRPGVNVTVFECVLVVFEVWIFRMYWHHFFVARASRLQQLLFSETVFSQSRIIVIGG